MAEPFSTDGSGTAQAISAGQVNHLPIVAHFARGLGLVETINGLVPIQMQVEPGLIVLGLVLDTLSGRSPLYHLSTAFEGCDRALLFDQELPVEYFSDDNVGRMLDCLYETGTQRIFSALSISALERFPVSTHHAHFDTTSVSLYGDYLTAQGKQAPFDIAHGYSKDKRPDLKQFVLSLLCVDGNVPIVGKLPATYNEHERVIGSALESEAWEDVGRLSQSAPTKNRPGASYRVHEGSVGLYGKDYRAVVVHSSAHDQRRQKRLERELRASREQIYKWPRPARKSSSSAAPMPRPSRPRCGRTAVPTTSSKCE